jgi:hypothetical protein
MYLKGNFFSISDILRSKILRDEDDIKKIFKLMEIVEFGEVEVTLSASNRNSGKELYTLKINPLDNILSTAQGRARFNLFRLNKGLVPSK